MKKILLTVNDSNREIDFHQLLDAGIYGLPGDAIYKNAPQFTGDSTLIVVPSYNDSGNKDIHHVLFTEDAQIFTEFYIGVEKKWSDWLKESGGGGGDGATGLEVISADKSISQNAKSSYDPKTKTLQIDVSAKGVPGPKGDKGDTGPAGKDGVNGKDGAQGAKGDTGPEGKQGEQGPKGERGEKGDTGPEGKQGIQGEKGLKGDTGATGAQGKQGEKGDKGEKGDAGLSGDSVPMYDFTNAGLWKLDYDTNIIPSVKSFSLKNNEKFPSQQIVITIPRVMDTFYHEKDALCVCINLGSIETTMYGTQEKIKVGVDCVSYSRVYTFDYTKTAIRVDNEWCGFTFDASKILANMSLCDKNQVLITITGTKAPAMSDPIPALPLLIDRNDGTNWRKNNIQGCGQLSLSRMRVFAYDFRDYKNFGDGTVVYNLTMPFNQFSAQNWERFIVFQDTGIESVRSDHTIVINVIANDMTVNSPYKVFAGGDKAKVVFPMINKATERVVRITCYGNNIFIG